MLDKIWFQSILWTNSGSYVFLFEVTFCWKNPHKNNGGKNTVGFGTDSTRQWMQLLAANWTGRPEIHWTFVGSRRHAKHWSPPNSAPVDKPLEACSLKHRNPEECFHTVENSFVNILTYGLSDWQTDQKKKVGKFHWSCCFSWLPWGL